MSATTTEFGTFDRLFIGGEFVAPVDGAKIASINPATGAVWADVASAAAEDIDRAVAAADRAFRSGPWRKMTGGERGRLMEEFARRVVADVDRLATIESTDNGKPITLCRGDVANVGVWLRYFAGLADKMHGERIPLSADDWAYTIPEPLGVVGAIVAWNSPLLLAAWKLGPALAAGNTVVLKPSELAPASSLRLAELARDAGLPPGVINVVPGFGPTAGEALVTHPSVAKLSFTGSDATGRRVAEAAGRGMKSVTLECGGKAPLIVFEDADIDEAAAKAVGGMFVNAGQQCTVASRVLVQRPIYDRFVDRYLESVRGVAYGDPADPKTLVGAIVSQKQLDKIRRALKIARDEGAEILAGGSERAPSDPRLANGYWIEPTVLAGVNPQSSVFQDEIFGPVVLIQPFADEDDAIELANSVRYGLVSGVFTRDIRRAHRVASRLEAGLVWVNTYRRLHPSLPYGGVKQSGLGREGGLDALRAYTRVKSVIVDGAT
jgi:acyl-CoA reductase-like NAD-dependent aldehyde dehydrogenase